MPNDKKDNVVTLYPSTAKECRLAESEVTLDRLRAALELAAIETEIDGDGDIATGNGFDFPIWISLDPSSRLVHLSSYLPTALAYEAVNDLNRRFKIVQFARVGDRTVANYQLIYRFGLDTRHVIAMARQFAEICRIAHKETAVPEAD